jgi:hypothetical protein
MVGALDKAAKYYNRMTGGTQAVPTGRIEELMLQAHEQGSLTPGEIAEILDTPEYLVGYEASIRLGGE